MSLLSNLPAPPLLPPMLPRVDKRCRLGLFLVIGSPSKATLVPASKPKMPEAAQLSNSSLITTTDIDEFWLGI